MKYNFDYVKKTFQEKGCDLLEDSYKFSYVSMKYKCKCGNIGQTSFSSFKKSNKNRNRHFCNKCWTGRGKTQPLKKSQQEVKSLFAQYGCELISEYKNKKTKVFFKCKCGNVSTTICNNFKRSSHHCCRECWVKTFSGENHYNWCPDREFLESKQKFHRRCATLLFNVLNELGLKKKQNKKTILGFSPEELRMHLMSHPNWERVKNQDWEIDHIFPVSAFARVGILDLKLINCLENLQPLTALENKVKGGKYDHDLFESWLKSKRNHGRI